MMFYFVLSVLAFVAVAVLVPQIVRGIRRQDPFRPLSHDPRDPDAYNQKVIDAFDADARTIRRAREGRR